MSLENDLHEVKEKLAKDQNLLVNVFRLETFYKKYKIWIFILIAIILLFAFYKGIAYYIEYNNKEESANLMNALQSKNITAEQRSATEKELQDINPMLYDFYRYTLLQNLDSFALKQEENLNTLKELMDSKHPLIAALATYQYATFTQNLELLEFFDQKASPILRDRARFQAAYLYMKENNIQKARQILDSIQPNTQNQALYHLASELKHYGITQDTAEQKRERKDEERANLDSQTLKN